MPVRVSPYVAAAPAAVLTDVDFDCIQRGVRDDLSTECALFALAKADAEHVAKETLRDGGELDVAFARDGQGGRAARAFVTKVASKYAHASKAAERLQREAVRVLELVEDATSKTRLDVAKNAADAAMLQQKLQEKQAAAERMRHELESSASQERAHMLQQASALKASLSSSISQGQQESAVVQRVLNDALRETEAWGVAGVRAIASAAEERGQRFEAHIASLQAEHARQLDDARAELARRDETATRLRAQYAELERTKAFAVAHLGAEIKSIESAKAEAERQLIEHIRALATQNTQERQSAAAESERLREERERDLGALSREIFRLRHVQEEVLQRRDGTLPGGPARQVFYHDSLKRVEPVGPEGTLSWRGQLETLLDAATRRAEEAAAGGATARVSDGAPSRACYGRVPRSAKARLGLGGGTGTGGAGPGGKGSISASLVAGRCSGSALAPSDSRPPRSARAAVRSASGSARHGPPSSPRGGTQM